MDIYYQYVFIHNTEKHCRTINQFIVHLIQLKIVALSMAIRPHILTICLLYQIVVKYMIFQCDIHFSPMLLVFHILCIHILSQFYILRGMALGGDSITQ